MSHSMKCFRRRAGFTLVELLVSTAIIALIMMVLVGITNQTAATWRYTTEKIEKFQSARDGFESMTRRLSQATLNTYWDYLGFIPPALPTSALVPRSKDISSNDYKNFIPLSYGRMSELRFVSAPMSSSPTFSLMPSGSAGGSGDDERYWPTHGVFFQAPLGIVTDTAATKTTLDLNANAPYGAMDNLLNSWGYFVEVGDDIDRPSFISSTIAPKRWRARLMEFMQPSEKMAVHDLTYPTPATSWSQITSWVSTPLQIPRTSSTRPVRVLAENVVAMIILPKLSKEDEVARGAAATVLSPNYIYDSTRTANPPNNTGPTPPADSEINPKNQLPPIVQVTMIAVDERSAARYVDRYGRTAVIGPDTSTMFLANSQTFEKLGTGELAVYEKQLVDMGITYRIFTSNISIRGAKWSRSQTQ
jgi:uncharacterized protein (TIGR02599 family)